MRFEFKMPDETVIMGPPPEGAICDFCSSPDVHWSYPCRDHSRNTEHFVAVGVKQDGSSAVADTRLDSFSRGDWAACNVCHALIERGFRDTLSKRSARRLVRKLARQGVVYPLPNATAQVRRLHDAFWANREGEPTYHEHRPKGDHS